MIPNQMAEVERFQLNTVESSEDYLQDRKFEQIAVKQTGKFEQIAQDSRFEQIAVKQAGKFEQMTKFFNNVKN